MINFRYILALAAVILIVGCKRSEYDKAAYNELEQQIDGGSEKFVGLSLDDTVRMLSLEGVKWDEGYSPNPMTQLRIYHFEGFYLLLNLRMIPQMSTYLTPKPAAQSGKAQNVWFVSGIYPALHIDGLRDPEERMHKYWEGVREGLVMHGQNPNQVIPTNH